MRPKIRTMEELSEAIGVSRPTLSRYFQDAARLRASTRQRIEAGLARVDYVPNFFAINMNRKQTRLIGVIVPHLNDLFYTSLIRAIETAALARDYMILTQSSHGDPAVEMRAAEYLRSMNADGVIVGPLGEESSREALERLNADLPLVFVDSPLPGASDTADFAGTDNAQSIGLMVDYLCRSGPPPAFLAMPRVNLNANAREEGYRTRMQALGHDPVVIRGDPAYHGWEFEDYGHTVMSGEFAAGRHMRSTILCANDRMAVGVIKAATRHSLFAPREEPRFRVAGHDDDPMARFLCPALTTVTQDVPAIGEAALSLLVDRISGEVPPDTPGRTRLFDGRLVLRDSA